MDGEIRTNPAESMIEVAPSNRHREERGDVAIQSLDVGVDCRAPAALAMTEEGLPMC
jgi:hypothetical protein